MPVPGVPELIIILVLVAMLFGVGKLPEVFGAVGRGIREFRKESTLADEKNAKATAKSEPTVVETTRSESSVTETTNENS